jgi:hypothetical protein
MDVENEAVDMAEQVSDEFQEYYESEDGEYRGVDSPNVTPCVTFNLEILAILW